MTDAAGDANVAGAADAGGPAEPDAGGARIELPARTYRHLDRSCKLLGVGLVALGLDAGGDSLVGLALGASGAAVALATVFVRRRE